ncbi:ABC transporter ATP-binding protein [Tessaracoccus palaemonis]|uniref:Dipeptide/oligopeptide/nickel ABC transporter ATP-binding protein n=1 Tax=Tessaracoccus palaemonis TaxID=2829499 RepID=A0ABX8SJU0_9ACTN|nr:dipeptide/oligopeptide/nickel ABC transporter ATP-binding protein [Tessaracoccus palaemonis]QXT63575.1 dipeptide/oligopeptide/nickel ABC transporter ATP-binding protein [Tessaracoccus palaemonis]
MSPVLEIRDLVKTYGDVRAVDGVSLTVGPGECLGIVGESGSGKSTLARCLLTLERPDSGDVLLEGRSLVGLRGGALKESRQRLQVVFQNPASSFNSKLTMFESLMEPLRIRGDVCPSFVDPGTPREVAVRLLDLVQLPKSVLDRKPGELSGGEKQRVAIARAISVEPTLMVFDEPTASLDVSIQARVLNLLQDLKDRLGISAVFISHDLSAVQFMSERSIVLRGGRIVDEFHRDELFDDGRDSYTRELIRLFED